jgi:hypothetical protein
MTVEQAIEELKKFSPTAKVSSLIIELVESETQGGRPLTSMTTPITSMTASEIIEQNLRYGE